MRASESVSTCLLSDSFARCLGLDTEQVDLFLQIAPETIIRKRSLFFKSVLKVFMEMTHYLALDLGSYKTVSLIV